MFWGFITARRNIGGEGHRVSSWYFETGLEPSGRATGGKKLIDAAVARPRPSPWSHWIAKVMIADFVRSAFKFFPFLNLHKHIISKVLVRSLNSTNLLSRYKVQN